MSKIIDTNASGFVVEPDDESNRRTFINDVKINNDIEKKTIIRLGKYMSDLTHGDVGTSKHPNAYPIDSEINYVKLTSNKGKPIQLRDSTNTERFVDKRQDLVNTSLDNTLRIPNPGIIGLNETWQKGSIKGDNENIITGNELLQTADNKNSPVKKITSAILSNNRFTIEKSMNSVIQAGTSNKPKSNYNPTVRIPTGGQQSLGTYNANNSFNDDSFDKLALIGYVLSLRGSGEVGSNAENFDPLSTGTELKSLLPSMNQLSVERLNVATLQAKDVYSRLKNTTVPEGNMLHIGDLSWGVMNNVHEQFSGMSALSMPALAMALTAAVLTTLELLGGAASLIAGQPVNAPTKHPDGRYVFGKWSTQLTGKNSKSPLSIDFPPSIGDTLGLRPTEYPFMKALNKGMMLFFGIDTSSGPIGAIVSGINSSLDSPGYNAVVCRTILRSSLSIVDQIKDTFKSSNIISGAKNVLDLLQIIKNSKLMAAINIFTALGDRALADIDSSHVIDHDGIIYNSEIDFFENNADAAAVKKSKLNGTSKLAWANNRTPSMFLMPSTIMGLSIASIAGKGSNDLGAPLQHTLRSEIHSKNETIVMEPNDKSSGGSGLRIPQISSDESQLTVDKIERMLDAEYMPFYFHDLRTNEIISFHAFLNSLTEDYQPQWESSEGFGRVDKIKIYKSTDRRITTNFWIASTSQNDFDDMWVKINKLVTLVYPQYTAGRKLSTKDYNFTMPFSQMISSSPIIRLRIGDLIRSNYSKFNLSRIFGMADYDGPTVQGKKLQFETNYQEFLKIKQKYEELLKQPWSKSSSYKWYITGVDSFNSPSSGASINVPVPIISSGEAASRPFQVPQTLLKYYNVKPIKKYDVDGGNLGVSVSTSFSSNKSSSTDDKLEFGIFELSPMSALEIVENWKLDSQQAVSISTQLTKFEIKGKNNQKTNGRQYILPANAIKLQPTSIKQFWFDNSANASSGMEELLTFMSIKNNAIVKSFQETSGKGLAGTIDSLNFDWHDQTNWEIDPTRRAPTRCKVSLTFSPIHDISPGIDHNGYNRSPIYPVGNQFSEIIREKDK